MLTAQRFFGIFSCLALALGAVAGLGAQTPTATATTTPTPGSGSYSYTILNALQTPLPTPFVVPGNTGNSLQITYTLTSTFAPGGMLVFQFPSDLCIGPNTSQAFPNANAFYCEPFYQPYLAYSVNGDAVSVTTQVSIPAGTPLVFTYGQGPSGGFTVAASTTQTSEAFQVWSNPAPTVVAGVGLVPAPSPILVYSATVSPTMTPTYTVSPTFTISATFTASPTFTISPTSTPTPTITPIGHAVSTLAGFYSYPNPFDLRLTPFVTVRFPATTEAVSITIFSLAGNPVCEVPVSSSQAAAGFAQWNGTDDYGRTVPGGLYFVRLKTSGSTVVHKMTVFH